MIADDEEILDDTFPARFRNIIDAQTYAAAYLINRELGKTTSGYQYGQIDAAASRDKGTPVGRNPEWVSAPVEVRCVMKKGESPWGENFLKVVYRMEVIVRTPEQITNDPVPPGKDPSVARKDL